MDLFDYSMAKKDKSAEKPVLLAIFHGVYSAIPDKKRAIQNLVCLFVVGAVLFSMNSNFGILFQIMKKEVMRNKVSNLESDLAKLNHWNTK